MLVEWKQALLRTLSQSKEERRTVRYDEKKKVDEKLGELLWYFLTEIKAI